MNGYASTYCLKRYYIKYYDYESGGVMLCKPSWWTQILHTFSVFLMCTLPCLHSQGAMGPTSGLRRRHHCREWGWSSPWDCTGSRHPLRALEGTEKRKEMEGGGPENPCSSLPHVWTPPGGIPSSVVWKTHVLSEHVCPVSPVFLQDKAMGPWQSSP